jgi:hypothetical protein
MRPFQPKQGPAKGLTPTRAFPVAVAGAAAGPAAWLDNVRFTPSNSGVGDWVYFTPVTGYQSPNAAGALDGTVYRQFAISPDLTQWELASGAYVLSTGTFQRTNVLYNSAGTGTGVGQSGDGTRINFLTNPQVAVVAIKEDLLSLAEANNFTTTQKKQARANLGVPEANIIINGDFRINQRVYVSGAALAASTYAHDRWKAGASGGDYSFTQLANSTQITIAAGKSLIQVVEDRNVTGGTYVLSWSGTAQARVGVNSATPSGPFASSPILISGQAAGTTMSVEFGNGGPACTLGTVKLEQGAVATPFVMPDWGTELVKCQRYYEKSYDYGTAPGTSSSPNGYISYLGVGTVSNSFNAVFRQEKAATPTMVWYSPGTGASGNVYDSANSVDNTANALNVGQYNAVVYRNATSSSQSIAHWTASAEL